MGRLQRTVDSIRREASLWRSLRRADGVKSATLSRARHHAGPAEVGQRVQALSAQVDTLAGRLAQLEQAPRHAESLLPAMAWIEQAVLAREPLISVVMPTHERATLLPRAVTSVVNQSYATWELLIADDASTDETPAVIKSLADPRIRSIRVEAGGAAPTRNAALDHAQGQIVTYLDDDNVMHPGWLKAVAWAFAQRPDAEVLYGAVVIDDYYRLMRTGSGAWPAISWNPFDRIVLAETGLTDISAVAHRAGIPGARFDESLASTSDWDLLARLTADRDALVVPAIASFYYTDAPNRLSGDGVDPGEAERVRAKARTYQRR